MYEVLAGIRHRTTAGAFVPNTMIDTLFNYSNWLNASSSAGDVGDKSIAIVGSGVSGLIAAYELKKAGAKDVVVFEASDRIGGRMCSVQFDHGTDKHAVFELGCMRFPPASTTLYHYFKEFGIKTQPNFPDPGTYGVDAELYYQGKRIEWPGPTSKDSRTQPDSELFQRIGSDFNKILISLVGDPDKPAAHPTKLYFFWNLYQNGPEVGRAAARIETIKCWQALIDTYKNVSFEQAIFTLARSPVLSKQWTLDDMNAFGALGVGSGGFGPLFNIGFLEILRLLVNGFEVDQELVPEGISSFTDKLVSKCTSLGVKFIKNAPMRIDNNLYSEWTSRKFTLQRSNIHSRRWICESPSDMFDAVIIATTNRAAQMTGVTLADTKGYTVLPAEVNTAIQNLHVTASSKFFIRVKEKFWLKKGGDGKFVFPSNIQSDALFRGLYCLDYDPGATGGGVVLISYVWEDDSTKLMGLTKQQRYDQFLAALKVINPQFSAALDANKVPFDGKDSHQDYDLANTNMIDWQAQPFYYGAFKLDFPGTEQECHSAIYQFQSVDKDYPITICGDSVSWVGGWLEGAITSGLNAVAGVVKVLGKVSANSPIASVKPDTYDYTKLKQTTIY